MTVGSLLITGGTGYLGARLARACRDTADEIIIPIRAGGDEELDRRADLLRLQIGEDVRLRVVRTNLAEDRPFEGIEPRSVSRIIHAAAETRFNVDEETADRVNVEGTGKVLQFAEACPNLQSFDFLSTIYVAGLREGLIPEKLFAEPASFANHYERSKWEAECLIVDRFGNLPWRILRIATVIADDDTGAVTQHNAIHNTLKLLYYGLLSLIPGNPSVPLYFVTGAFVAEAARKAMEAPAHRVYHLCHERQESLMLEEFLETVMACFARDEQFSRRRALKPLYVDAESFDVMAGEVRKFGGRILSQAVGSVTPFARQLFSPKAFDNSNLRAAWPGYASPDPVTLVRNCCERLMATRFSAGSMA
ncbi:MAG: SDR family oxidoreductase [Acidobacteriota bacterium]